MYAITAKTSEERYGDLSFSSVRRGADEHSAGRAPPAPGASAATGHTLNGLPRTAVEYQLHALWQLHRTPLATPRQRRLVEALVYLRRTGRYCYDLSDHRRMIKTETSALLPDLATRAARAALPVGSLVRILGEPRAGVVIHMTLGWTPHDAYPAPWYVVAVPARRLCRAHGADEVEELAAPRARRDATGPVPGRPGPGRHKPLAHHVA